MGQSLRGKECGKGICQRKDGLYYARLGWSCVILFLSTGVPGNRQRTVPMIPTFISYATKQELKNSVCTLYATRAIERGMQLKVLQTLPCHASIKTTMDRYVHVTFESLDQAVRLFEPNRVSMRKWCKNGVNPKRRIAETLDKSRLFKEMQR